MCGSQNHLVECDAQQTFRLSKKVLVQVFVDDQRDIAVFEVAILNAQYEMCTEAWQYQIDGLGANFAGGESVKEQKGLCVVVQINGGESQAVADQIGGVQVVDELGKDAIVLAFAYAPAAVMSLDNERAMGFLLVKETQVAGFFSLAQKGLL